MAKKRNDRIVGDSIYQLARANFARQASQAKALSENAISQALNRLNIDKRQYSPDKLLNNEREVYGDAAGRGMLTSSTTAENISKLDTGWQDQLDKLQLGYDQTKQNAGLGLQTTNQQIDSQREQAWNDLIRRREAARKAGY